MATIVVCVSRLRDLFARRRVAPGWRSRRSRCISTSSPRQYIRKGNTPAEARRLARAKFGGVAQVRESLRDQAGFPMLESILHDVRYAARSLVRQPGTTALVVGILALGLGVNTGVLAVAYGVLWRPLPYADADRLVTVARVYAENGSESGVRFDRIDEWNRRLRTIRVAGHNARERVVRGVGPTRVMQVASVTADFFEVLGAPAVQGVAPRFANGDSRAVISASLARTLEDEGGGSALGRTMTVGDGRYDVAAVMPTGFGFPSADVDVWLSQPATAPVGWGYYHLVGRLRDGATLAQARDDATRVARETLDAGADLYSAVVRPVDETLRGELRPVLRVSIAAALLVLVVACANAATLLIGRSVVRTREFAIRIALGSGLAPAGPGRAARGAGDGCRRTDPGPRDGLGRSAPVRGPGRRRDAAGRRGRPRSAGRAGRPRPDPGGRRGLRRRLGGGRGAGGRRRPARGRGGDRLADHPSPAGGAGGRPDRAVHRPADRRPDCWSGPSTGCSTKTAASSRGRR